MSSILYGITYDDMYNYGYLVSRYELMSGALPDKNPSGKRGSILVLPTGYATFSAFIRALYGFRLSPPEAWESRGNPPGFGRLSRPGSRRACRSSLS